MVKISVRPSVIVFDKDKILVVKSVYRDGEYYLLPGGGVEGSETLPECAVRETLEETGQKIKIVKLAFVNDYITDEGRCLNVFFVGKLLERGELTHLKDPSSNGKIRSAEWRTVNELLKLDFRPKELIRMIKAGKINNLDSKDVYFRT